MAYRLLVHRSIAPYTPWVEQHFCVYKKQEDTLARPVRRVPTGPCRRRVMGDMKVMKNVIAQEVGNGTTPVL